MRARLEVSCALAACAALAPRAAAADVRALVGLDSYVATAPSSTTTDVADVALSAHVAWQADDHARGATVDWVQRESLIGDDPRRELQELSYCERGIPSLALTAGRFRAPSGAWLIVDGGAVAYRGDAVEAGVFAGSRAFTSGRQDTLLSRSPAPLPLVGAAVTARGDTAQAELAYTATSDRIEIYQGGEAPGGPGEHITTIQTPEQYVDGQVAAQLSDAVFVSAGGTVGHRYVITYPTDPARLGDDPTLERATLAAQTAYALVDARVDAWRLSATASLQRASLGAVGDGATAAALAPITGSFGEGALRAAYRPGPAVRVEARYRARVRLDGTRDQRAQLAGAWRRGDLELQGMVGVDLEHPGTPAPGLVAEQTILYRAAVAHRADDHDVALGVAAVAAIGSELSTAPGDAGDQRAPYTLGARSYAFLDAFAHRGGWFGGVTGEIDLNGQGVRVLTQLGWTL